MKNSVRKLVLGWAVTVLLLTVLCFSASAEEYKGFEYYRGDQENTVSIYAYNGKASNVVIPETIDGAKVTEVGFDKTKENNQNKNIKSVTIPASVMEINGLNHCPNLAKITVATDSKYLSVDKNGVLYNKDKTELISYPPVKKGTSFKIPSTVKTVNPIAFFNCKDLQELSIPASVTSISFDSFNKANLKKITVDSKNKKYSSDKNGVLFNKNKTLLIMYPAASTITEYTVPKTVTTIEGGAFTNADNLKSVTVSNGVEMIGWGAFQNCDKLKSVKLPDGLKGIEMATFYECAALENINIPKGIESIGSSCFGGCTSLKSVDLPDSLKGIGCCVFSGCSGLESLTIPKNVEYIAECSFNGCVSIEKISVSSKNKFLSVDKNGVLFNKDKTRFVLYPLASKMKSYTIPASITEFYYNVFTGAVNLEEFKVSSKSTIFSTDKNGVLYNKEKNRVICVPAASKITSFSVPEGTTSVGGEFTGCKNLKTLKIPASVEYINLGDCGVEKIIVSAKNKNFSSDENGVLFNKKKTELVKYPTGKTEKSYAVPASVKTINYGAFSQNESLEAIFVPKTVKEITFSAFDYCAKLKNIYFEGSKETWKTIKESEGDDPAFKKVKINYNHKHSYKTAVVAQATEKVNGKSAPQCVCGKINAKGKTTAIYKIKSVKLAETKYTYNGKVVAPAVTVKDSKGKKLKKDTDYTVKYSKGRKSPGKYTVTVTFKGKYSGTEELTFTIVPAKVTLSKVTAGKKTATPSWKAVSGASGYEVQYSASSKFKSAKTATVKKGSAKKVTIKKLTKGKKYYFKVRAFKTISGKKAYGAWSAVKSVKVK